jgi:hypothetical protein
MTFVPDVILESPGWKTFFLVVIPALVGVLSGTLVAEITVAGQLDWSLIFRAGSFYCLSVVVLLSYLYYRAIYLHEREVLRFLDDDYCRAYMRSKCLPEAAERYKASIRAGDKKELVNAMRDLEKILK